MRPDRVHIRGLDDLKNNDIKAFALAHFAAHEPKIEWIDGQCQLGGCGGVEVATGAIPL